jgi:hypothetical protein
MSHNFSTACYRDSFPFSSFTLYFFIWIVHVRPSHLPPPQLTDSWYTNWLSSDLVDLHNLCIWLSASGMNCNSCCKTWQCLCYMIVSIHSMNLLLHHPKNGSLIHPVHILTVCFCNMKFHIALVFEVVSLTRFLYKNVVSDFHLWIHTKRLAYCIHLYLI